MFILKTKVHNFKGVKEFEVDWLQNGNNLVGENKAGKTTILDSIVDGFKRLGMKEMPQPVHTDAGNGYYEHQLGTFGGDVKLTVKRMYRKTGATQKLTITPEIDGMTAQQVLNMIWNNACKLDVAELKNRKPEEWQNDILDMMGVKQELQKIDSEYRRLYDERTGAARDRKNAQAVVSNEKPDKVEYVNDTEIINQLQNARTGRDLFNIASQEQQRCQKRIEMLRQEIADLEQTISSCNNDIVKYASSSSEVDKLETMLVSANDTNAKAREYEQYVRNVAHAEETERIWKELDEQVKAIPEQRRTLFTTNHCPIEEITMDDDGRLLYDGIPIEQINDGSRILLGVAVYLAKLHNVAIGDLEELRTVLIENGNLADSNTRTRIRKMCIQAQCQDITELVIGEKWDNDKQEFVPDYDTADHIGIVLKEGERYGK